MSSRGRTSGRSALTASSPERATHAPGTRRRLSPRILLLAFAVASMAAGLYAGLVRLGFDLPDGAGLADIHGPLMICGVFGTLISLERAVAIGLGWPYLAPAGFALSSLLSPPLAVSHCATGRPSTCRLPPCISPWPCG